MVDFATALVVRDSRVLMGYRSANKTAYPSTWDSIGGRVEPGESIAEALVRELQEEIGIIPIDWSHLETVSGIETHEGPTHLHIHVVTKWSGGEPVMLGDEHDEIRWFLLDELAAEPNLASREYLRLADMAVGPVHVGRTD
jgi:8-oxo-dGTP diphosphatase